MKISPIFRMSLGLLLLMISIILVADMLGFVPSKNQANLEARKKFSESLSIQIAKSAENNQVEFIGVLLQQLVTRNKDVISVALIDKQGDIITKYGKHKRNWEKNTTISLQRHHTFRFRYLRAIMSGAEYKLDLPSCQGKVFGVF